MLPSVGTNLAPYEILALIGAGCMGKPAWEPFEQVQRNEYGVTVLV